MYVVIFDMLITYRFLGKLVKDGKKQKKIQNHRS